MPKKRSSTKQHRVEASVRGALPAALVERLQVVWLQVGHLIDWCPDNSAWTRLFCTEVRPYWETFYWESIARMVTQYVHGHPAVSPEESLSECLIATQCPPSPDDCGMLAEFRAMWNAILNDAQGDIESSMQGDLELARQNGTGDMVAALYAADQQKRQQG